MKHKTHNNRGDAAIIVAFLLLLGILIIAIGVSTLMIRQIHMSGEIGRAVVAYYAAEAGVEECLYEIASENGGECDISSGSVGPFTGTIGADGAIYTIEYDFDNSWIRSRGEFIDTNRKLELSW